ncbi:permease [Desulfovermiculus halophilus]|jgi:hypothetical protein|uniref:permease n=1 Tax=Desulfovermiculus halophilus TaxID=339722 RepID=UPI000483F748|nr:permease [Desulfovermiculus halophilus]
MNNLITSLKYFAVITAELTVLFIGISVIVALILMYISENKLRLWLARRGAAGNVLGAVAGSLTPFCACSTIPMTLGFLNAGVPFGSVMSFVIASPLLNPIIIGMIAVLMGIKACLIYFAITFAGAVCFGIILEKWGGAGYVKNVRVKKGCCEGGEPEIPASFPGRLRAALATAWSDFRGVMIYLLVGVGIGAVIYGYIPQEWIVRVAGPGNPLAIPAAAVIGAPLYIRAESAIPIGLALLEKGMSMGAVIALIIGGAGMAIPEMAMLAGIFKKRLLVSVVAVIFITAVTGGYVFNIIL